MRIAFVLQRFNEIGGIGEVVENLARTFSLLGHQILIASSWSGTAPGYERRIDRAWELHYLKLRQCESIPRRSLTFLIGTARLTQTLRQWKPDVISSHVYDWRVLPLIASARNIVKSPVVHTFHDCAHQAAETTQRRWLGSLVRFNALTAVSLAAKRSYAALVQTAERATVITNGVESASDDVVPFVRSRPYVFCAARYNIRQKALDTLVNSFAEVAKESPEVDLLIAGWGPDSEALERLIASTKTPDRIELIGSREHSSLRRLHKGAMFFAMPSRWEEALGMGLLEAMAQRRAVIATRIGGVPEVITDGENGLLVDVEDSDGLTCALQKLLRDDTLRNAMGECGYRRVQRHHRWDDLARRYLDVFEAARN